MKEVTKPFNGLKEKIALETAKDRVIQNPTVLNTTLEKLYDHLSQSYEIDSYAGLSSETNIGFAELYGERDAQEDRIAFGIVPDFGHLSEDDRQSALKQTISQLTRIINDNDLRRIGSTLCAAVIYENRIYTANVGDSTAYLAVLDADGQPVQFQRLNKALHHPTDSAETERLEHAGKEEFIHHQRLMGLALSRSMGDIDLEAYGLIHTPDIYRDEIEIPEKGKAFVIVACDGLTEGGCLLESRQEGGISIEELIQATYQHHPKEIAKILAHEAINMGSGDNVSVLVTEIDVNSSMPRYMAVFDGHGGNECAELLRKNFHRVFVDEIGKKSLLS